MNMDSSQKKWIMRIVALILLIIVSGVATTWIYNHYLPMKRAESIVQKLRSRNPQLVGEVVRQLEGLKRKAQGDYSHDKQHKPLKGMAATRVKDEVIAILNTSQDTAILAMLFRIVIGSPDATGLQFTEKDWQIIKKATEVYNRQKGTNSANYLVKKDTDRGYAVVIRHFVD